jgi:hypothetical protein
MCTTLIICASYVSNILSWLSNKSYIYISQKPQNTMCVKSNGCPSILWHYGFTATKECQMLKWQERRNIAQAGSLQRLTASPTWAANLMDHLNMGYSLLVIIFPKKLVILGIFGVSNFWANSCWPISTGKWTSETHGQCGVFGKCAGVHRHPGACWQCWPQTRRSLSTQGIP